MPRPTPPHFATSRALIKEPHLLAKFAAAQSLHDYSTSPPIAAQTAKLRSEAVGWMLPNWKASTTMRCVGNASVWYDVMKYADQLSRLAMRDSCSTFKRLYAELDFDELNLSRVAFNCRYKKRIYALDYRALKMSSLDDKTAPITIAAVPVLREIRAFGRERGKVVQRGSIFFSLLTFGWPATLSPDKFAGKSDPSTQYCFAETPAKRTLIEWLHYPDDERIPVTLTLVYDEYRTWESEALDGEGLDDTFTLEQISQIVAGRYESPSSRITSWGDNFRQDRCERPRDICNQYMMLQDLGIGWYLMTASEPELDDL
ncbi:hypothetical protein RQP46_002624 [Phenoliferia psychrophenolica]